MGTPLPFAADETVLLLGETRGAIESYCAFQLYGYPFNWRRLPTNIVTSANVYGGRAVIMAELMRNSSGYVCRYDCLDILILPTCA